MDDKSGFGVDWTHPVSTFIYGVVLTLFLAHQYLHPAWSGEDRQEVLAARRDKAAWAGERDKLAAKIGDLETRLDRTTRKLREVEAAAFFQYGNPYPIGLSDVKVGDLALAIEQAHAASKIEKEEDGDIRVVPEHAVVRWIKYAIDQRSRTVTRVWVALRAPDDTVPGVLFTAMFGAPISEIKNWKTWNLPNGLQVGANGNLYYVTKYATSSTTKAK